MAKNVFIEYLNAGLILLLVTVVTACDSGPKKSDPSGRIYSTGFESVDEFNEFYIVEQNHMGTASHDLDADIVKNGSFSHKGWIYGVNPESTPSVNNNHRGYPAIQFYKTSDGAIKTPALIEFWVWLDVSLVSDQWFSFATLDHTHQDTWDPVLVNLSDSGIVHLMHVPANGEKVWDYQTTTVQFPMKEWVKISICLEFDQSQGYVKVWQNDQLVSAAAVQKGNGELTQAHFGLYAPPSLDNGTIYNDDLVITEGECM